METICYSFRAFNYFEGYMRFDLEIISKEKINNYIKYLELKYPINQYSIVSNQHIFMCKWIFNDYSFIIPQVLFGKHKIDLNIINIFGEDDIKFILKSWMRDIGTTEYYDSWLYNSINIDKFIEEAAIKIIIE